VLLSGADWDNRLWWITLAAGIAAVVVSVATGYIGRKLTGQTTERTRLKLHLLSYILLTVSVVAFVMRGLIAPR
jgi:F0F1-type ATP synthase membrane subunit c/vacuolar-type H+-ATPase subunit K